MSTMGNQSRPASQPPAQARQSASRTRGQPARGTKAPYGQPGGPSGAAGAVPTAKPGSSDDVRQNLRGMNYADGAEYVRPGGELSAVGTDGAPAKAAASKGPAADLPHQAQLQQAFGPHDLEGARAHVGGGAGQTAAALGTRAYTQGDDVAFQSAPDLHVAAHEAAHVIQQRQGRLPAGGKSQKGDPLEREADEVARRAAAGQSAADLLGPAKTGKGKQGPAQAIQAFAGNVDTATTSGPGTVREQVEANFGRGPAGERDSNFNPALKVEFEGKLGRALLVAQGYYRPVIDNVSYGIYRYLQAKAASLGQDEKKVMDAAFESFSFMYDAFEAGKQAGGVFYGRIRDDMADKDQYFQQMTDLLLSGKGTVQNQMLAHQCFLDKVLDAAKDGAGVGASQPAAQFLQRMKADAAQCKDQKDKQLAEASAPELKHLRKARGGTDPFGEQAKGVNGMEARGRLDMRKGFNAKKGGVDPQGALPAGVRFDERLRTPSKVEHSMGIAAQEDMVPGALGGQDKELGLDQVHSRGIETYTLDESQTFIQQARASYNMPLAAGISGTTTDLHEVAQMFGVKSPEDQFKYQLACLAHLGSAGAHSFHEIMAAAAQNTSVQYEPGNYRSILRYGVESIADVKVLFDDPAYAQIPGIGDPARLGGKSSETPLAAAAPPVKAPSSATAPRAPSPS